MHAPRELVEPRHNIHPFRSGVFLIVITILGVTAGGLYSADMYVRSAVQQLNAVVPANGSFDYIAAEYGWSHDTDRLERLDSQWPLSIPTILGDMVVLAYERHQITHLSQQMDRGYNILTADNAGKDHMLSVFIRGRIRVLMQSWSREKSQDDWLTYRGHALSPNLEGHVVKESDVVSILDRLLIPDHVLTGLNVTILPFVLEGTAGLGSKGRIVLGAAPMTTSIVAQNRTAYTLLHELGHHIHFSYLDTRSNQKHTLWNDYLNLRGIKYEGFSEKFLFDEWHLSPEETFAEDFRMLFGPVEARSVSHGTVYGDPTDMNDRGFALRHLIADVISMERKLMIPKAHNI